MKNITIFTLSTVIAFSLMACAGSPSSDPAQSTPQETSTQVPGSAQLANPWVNAANIEEAEELAGFDFLTPSSLPENYELKSIRLLDNKLVELIYQNGEHSFTYRTCKTEDTSQDISGDFTAYEEETSLDVGEISVTAKGSKVGYSLAVWEKDGCSYSIRTSSEFTKEDLVKIIESIA